MQGNMNMVKFDKQSRFVYEEAQERTTKGRKLNKTKHQNKRQLWNDEDNDN